MTTKKIELLHSDHMNWLKELNLMQDELKYFQDKLAHFAALYFTTERENTVNNIRKKAIMFFYEIDELRYMIHLHEIFLSEEIENAKQADVDHCLEKDKLILLKERFKSFKIETLDFIKQQEQE